MPDSTQAVSNQLTDGTGISKLTPKKLIKDFVADALISLPASLVIAGVSGVPTDTKTLIVAVNAVLMPVAAAAYRALLRWAQSPD